MPTIPLPRRPPNPQTYRPNSIFTKGALMIPVMYLSLGFIVGYLIGSLMTKRFYKKTKE
ncbi:unnamed protein product [marine sediment metagenome]|uniref:Uncharacterized protein n=1 Tax=marine sediment metagenome TaxID=412755 RepID=X1Q2V8_9ZZZZ